MGDAASNGKQAVVDHVADGDTIAVRVSGRDEEIRFIGIDTLEVYFGVECDGPQASASMKRMLEPGDQVNLVRDRTQTNRDRYDACFAKRGPSRWISRPAPSNRGSALVEGAESSLHRA